MVEKIKRALENAYAERVGNPDRKHLLKERGDPRARRSAKSSASYILSDAELVEVDLDHLAANRVIAIGSEDDHQESYRLLRTQIQRLLNEHDYSTIGITSPRVGEGKSLTSLNLAVSLARNPDLSVILVDGDLERPSLHDLLGVESQFGFVDFLKGEVDLQDVLLKLSIPNLWLIPGRRNALQMQAQVSLNQVEELTASLPVSDGIIIFDLPQALSSDHTIALASRLDGIVLVVEEGATIASEVTLAVELLKQSNLIGTVVNKASPYSGKS